jgi:hypothetical protein
MNTVQLPLLDSIALDAWAPMTSATAITAAVPE